MNVMTKVMKFRSEKMNENKNDGPILEYCMHHSVRIACHGLPLEWRLTRAYAMFGHLLPILVEKIFLKRKQILKFCGKNGKNDV